MEPVESRISEQKCSLHQNEGTKLCIVCRNLVHFVECFVHECEGRLSLYHKIREETVLKKKPNAISVNNAVNQLAPMLSVFSQPGAVIDLAAKAINYRDEAQLRSETAKLADVINSFQDDKIGLRQKLVDAGCDVFQSFEMQFMGVTVEEDSRLALQLLAKDAAVRALNHVQTNREASLTDAILRGKSKAPFLDTALSDNDTVGSSPRIEVTYSFEAFEINWNSTGLYDKVGLMIEMESGGRSYYQKKTYRKVMKYGFRRLLRSEALDVEIYEAVSPEKCEQFIGYRYLDLTDGMRKRILAKINDGDKSLREMVEELREDINTNQKILMETVKQLAEDQSILLEIKKTVEGNHAEVQADSGN